MNTITSESIESEDVNWARQAAELYPNIIHNVIGRQEFPTVYSNLEDIPLTDQPAGIINFIGSFRYSMEVIKATGSQIHMSGEGGDAVVIAPHGYLADLVLRGQIKTFIRHFFGWCRASKRISPIPLMSNIIRLSTTSYRHWLSQQAQQLMTKQARHQQNQVLSLEWSEPADTVSWYTEEAIDLVVKGLQRYATVALPFADLPGQHAAVAGIHLMGRFARVEQQLAETYGVSIDFPYLDSLVLDACLSTKTENRTSPFAVKPIMYEAFHNDLPKSVLTRTTKGNYSPDILHGMHHNLALLKELLQNSRLADMGLIKIRDFRVAMELVSTGLQRELLGYFNETLVLELWLRRVLDGGYDFWMSESLRDAVTY